MTIIQKIQIFIKKKTRLFSILDTKVLQIQKFNPLFLIIFVIIFSGFFFISSNFINKKNEDNKNNFKEITKTDEFSNLSNFLISKINSPYREINYLIEKKFMKGFFTQKNQESR